MKKFKTNRLNNKEMSDAVYQLRRKVIDLIYEAKKLTDLPRIDVRVTDDHEKILGVARYNANIIWITENAVASRCVVFHEILHAVFGQIHVKGCPLMDEKIDPNLDAETCNRLFMKYVKAHAKKKTRTELECRPL